LVEVCPWNLTEKSNNFANWLGVNNVTITANDTTAPNGTTTASKIVVGSGSPIRIFDFIGNPTQGVYTISVYAKAGTGDEIILYTTNAYVYATYNLSNGTVTQGVGTASIENAGNGWYRCIVTNTIAAGEIGQIIFSGNSTNEYVYLYGYQTNVGSTAKPYFPTTDRLNVPRLTYQNGGGGCPSLLLEKQSTNEVQYSQELDNAYWFKYQGSITANQGISPDGTQNADLWTTSGSQSVLYRTGFTCNVLSYFAKAVSLSSGSKFYIQVDGVGNAEWNQDGTLSSVSGGTATNGQNMGNGWFRFAYIVTSGNVANYGLNGNTSTSTALFWGLQNEAGSYPTSYIPTTSASATRVADACSKTGISSLIGQTEGVIFTDFTINALANFGTPLSVNDGSTANYIWLTIFANGNLRAELFNSSGVQATITYSGAVVGGRYKMAFAYKTNDFAMYVNGSLVGIATSGTTFSGTTLSRIDNDITSPALYSLASQSINQSALFKTRLTNAELASLTTL
jgi:hypothetical protein